MLDDLVNHHRVEYLKNCDTNGFLGSLQPETSKLEVARLSDVYAQRMAKRPNPSALNSIPKILHQIWIGPKPIPEKYKNFMKGWKADYPDWEYRLWTDHEIKSLKLETHKVIAASRCYGQKTDLLRAEILLQFGGLYVDCDYESIKPFGRIHESYDFYGTLRALPLLYLGSPKTFPGPLLVCNSLIAARPHHPILRTYLDKVLALHQQPEKFKLLWHQRYSLARIRFSLDQIQRIKETTLKTYIPFHESVLEHIEDSGDRNIVFPPQYFNPIDYWHRYRHVIWRYWQKRFMYTLRSGHLRAHGFKEKLPETLAIHHSQASWLQA